MDKTEGLSPLATGLKGRCTRCGEGHLFRGFLGVAERCESCGLDFGFADSGDGPAVLIMFPVGTLIVLAWLISDAMFGWSTITHLMVWLPMTVVLSMALLRPFKGAMINLQYKAGARPGGGPGDQEDS